MKKLFWLLAVLLLTQTSNLTAQTDNPLRIGFGISNGIPTQRTFGYVLGGDVKLQKNITEKVALTASAGFNHYFETKDYKNVEDYPSGPAPWNAIPVKAGVKFFAGKNLYVAGEAGAAFFLEGGKPAFLWSPSVGVALSGGLDFSVKYENISGYTALRQVALRVAYGIPAKKISFKPKSGQKDGWQLNASLNPGVTIDDTRFVIGADLQLERYVSQKIAFTLSAGFTHFTSKNYNISYEYQGELHYNLYSIDQNLIPVKLGIKTFLAPRVYLAAAGGIAIDINGNSSAIWSAALGYQLTKRLDIGLKYENYSVFSNSNQISLRVGYRLF